MNPWHITLVALLYLLASKSVAQTPFDAAPFSVINQEASVLVWEDPREIHRVVVDFERAPEPATPIKLEYWGSWWPDRHLPKDREPGGGDIGWLELGNWYKYGWRTADAEVKLEGAQARIQFRPVNQKEFPKVKDYPAKFRYTLKLRVISDKPLPAIRKIQAFTDSTLAPFAARVVWDQPPSSLQAEVFNGRFEAIEKLNPTSIRVRFQKTVNSDPNTFDDTLVTISDGRSVFTFAADDLGSGPLFIKTYGAAVLAESDTRTYRDLVEQQKQQGAKSLYERIQTMPEQTWSNAWAGMPPKKSRIYYPLGLDGGRQRFRLNADGSIQFRSNDHYLKHRPGADTPRLDLEKSEVSVSFDLSDRPTHRTLQEEALPVCITTWETNGLQIRQTAFVTPLQGAPSSPVSPSADTFTVFMARFDYVNKSGAAKPVSWTYQYSGQDQAGQTMHLDTEGCLWKGKDLRAHLTFSAPSPRESGSTWTWDLAPGQTASVLVKWPYVVLEGDKEKAMLLQLDFDRERQLMAGYWRSRLNESARLMTPEPMLNEFYRAHASHLLINCEREPASDRRFARVGSFSYGAYGNESCMMVADLDRRGYHREARECLEAWLHYQGTVMLPGDFSTKEGILYGAGGYEAGGYNQHHGWILWCLAEHFRFTRDQDWLRRVTPGLIAGADWIIRETARTADRHELERGLLPAGSLEDIGDWWTWLSTSCYSWRGLDSAAWALEQIDHPDAPRLRQAADTYKKNLLQNFRKAAQRAPVVRLRNGEAVPHFPSHVHRRGRTFGWICETLEGALHLLITRVLDVNSPEAEWIINDYEDNLYLSNQYGYTLADFDKEWFSRGGMSMQACLLLDVEPYLFRDDVKHALRALFNGQSVSYFPDVRLNTEHALPFLDDWRGDHFKSSDESNAAGWLRYLFVREEGDTLLLGQAVPQSWLAPGQSCGMEQASTYYGPINILFKGQDRSVQAAFSGASRNPPARIQLRFRLPEGRAIKSVTVNDQPWNDVRDGWILLPGNIGKAVIRASYE